MHQDEDTVLPPKKDLVLVDKEEDLLVSVDVWFLVGECVRENVDVEFV